MYVYVCACVCLCINLKGNRTIGSESSVGVTENLKSLEGFTIFSENSNLNNKNNIIRRRREEEKEGGREKGEGEKKEIINKLRNN